MSYGLLKHSPKKVLRSALRWSRHGYEKGSRHFRVMVTVQHSIGAVRGRGRYHAYACVAAPGGSPKGGGSRSAKCSGYVHGSTPTKAMNAALRALAARTR